jgi:hypothetical protein
VFRLVVLTRGRASAWEWWGYYPRPLQQIIYLNHERYMQRDWEFIEQENVIQIFNEIFQGELKKLREIW